MTSRRSNGPTLQRPAFLGRRQPTPASRIPQTPNRTIPSLNSTIQARYQTLAHSDKTNLPPAGASQTTGVSSPYTVSMAESGLQFQTNAPSNLPVTDYLTSVLRPMFTASQESTSACIDQIGSAIQTLGLSVGNLSAQIKDMRKEAQDQTKEAAGILERTHGTQLSTNQVLIARLERLEKMVGTSRDQDGNKSLLNRLDDITDAIEGLLASTNNPNKILSDIRVHERVDVDGDIDMAVLEPGKRKMYADVAVDPGTPEPNPRLYVDVGIEPQTPEPAPVRYASPERRSYSDAAVGSRTPEPAPVLVEIGTSTQRHIYTDAMVHAKTPEPLPHFYDVGTSPLRQSYSHAAVGSRIASPFLPRRDSVILHEFDTLLSPSGSLAPGPVTSESNSPVRPVGDVDMDPVPLHEEFQDSPRTDSPLPAVSVQAHFTHAPAAPQSLSRVSWPTTEKTQQTITSEVIDESELFQAPPHRESDEVDELVPVFHPNPSPSANESYTLLKEDFNMPEGSVRSLRLTALGDSLAGPTSSPSREVPIIPIASRPSVSPPSPYSLSPSCSPRVPPEQPQPSLPSQPMGIINMSRSTTPDRPSTRVLRSPQLVAREASPTQPDVDVVTSIPSPHTASNPAHSAVPTPTPTNTQESVDQVEESLFLPSPECSFDSPGLDEFSNSQLVSEPFASPEPQPQITPDYLTSPTGHSQSFGSAIHLDSPVIPGTLELPDISTPPPSSPPAKAVPQKVPLPRRLTKPISSTKPPFIDLRESLNVQNRLAHDPQISHLDLTSIDLTETSRPSRQPKASVSKARAESPIYISSRSPSPPSDLEDEFDSDDGATIIPVKKKVKNEHVKSELPPPKKKIFQAKTTPPERESAAATRIKKRKVKISDTATEPPLKRARQKAEVIVIEEDDNNTKTKGNSKDVKGKGKEVVTKETKKDSKRKHSMGSTSPAKNTAKKVGRKPIAGSEWPAKSRVGGAKFHQKFIECEACFFWYHFGCVGIKPGDPVIKAHNFICPPCSSNGANPLVPNGKGVTCARPDCGEGSVDQFFVAGVIGRATKVEGGRGRRYLWLVKWEGYSVAESTWEEESSMLDPEKLIKDFTIAAEKEGLPDDPHITLLLKEAVRGGCVDPNT